MNEEILITKPDKGAGVVILNKNDYNDKMKTILNDTTKFLDLSFLPASSFQRLRKTCYLPIITAMLFTSFCATAIVGTLVARLNGWKSELNNTFLNPSPILVPRPTAKVFPALAKTTYAHNNFTNPLLVNIFLTTPNVPSITATKNFLFSLEVALPFTFLPLKRLSLNLSIPFCVSKKNSYTL